MNYLYRAAPFALLVAALTAGLEAQQLPAEKPLAPQQPAAAAPTPPVPGTVQCPAPTPPATLPARSFNAPVGMLLQPVLSSKVDDFEKFLAYVQDAVAKSTDATVRKQAQGWKIYKMTETGPNGDVLFAFLFDPAVPCVDYAFMPILSAAVPDSAKLTEIFNLYTSSVRVGPYLMNFVPAGIPAAPTAAGSSAKPSPSEKPQAPPRPLDANPVSPPK